LQTELYNSNHYVGTSMHRKQTHAFTKHNNQKGTVIAIAAATPSPSLSPSPPPQLPLSTGTTTQNAINS